MTETIPQQLCLGFVSFLSKSGSTKNKFPLYNNSLSFGRNLKCDCRILVPTCSKEHATIFVDQSVSPFTALLKVYSSNGVVFNGKDFSKGSDIPLNTGDEFIIAERTFRWEAASIEIVNVDSTPVSSRKPIRYSLIASAKINTPTKSLPVSTFDGFASPFEPQAESVAVSQVDVIGFEGGMEDNGDLITWDEVEEEIIEEVVEDEVEEEADLELEEEFSPAPGASPVRRVMDFVLGATPALADRARMIRPPTSVRRIVNSTPKTKTTRRTSLRMTIAPQSRTVDWAKELELQKAARAISASLPIATIPQSIPSTPTSISIQSTPTRLPTSIASSRIASDHSNTSRRISALLLTPRSESGDIAAVYDSDDDADGISDDSSSEEEEEDFIQIGEVDEAEDAGEVPLHIAISEKLRILENREEEVEVAADDQDEEEINLATAANTALPDSPYGSPTATPRLPRHTPSRRHSLREKVLIRSAIRTTITPPPQSPTDELEQLELRTIPFVDAASSMQGQEEEETVAQELLTLTVVRPEDIPLPDSPATASPRRTPSGHRDSIEIFRSRSGAKQLFSDPKATLPINLIVADEETVSDDSSELVAETDLPASPSPAVRIPAIPLVIAVATPRTDRQNRAAAIPLPETPNCDDFEEDEDEDEDTDSFNPLLTPVKLVQQPPASPMDTRDAFFSEMTSPVNHHRVMATPRSVLRVGPSTGGRRKSIRGFLSFVAPPPSTRRKVVFNEQVYIQEIVDIRDKSLHWNPKIDKVPVSPRSVPLPASPTASEIGTPRISSRPATPTSTARRPRRVPTDAPPSIVRKAISEAQELASPSVLPSPRRVPIKSPAPLLISTPKNLTSPVKATSSTTPSASVQKPQRVTVTPSFKKATSTTTPSITSLLESAIPQMNSPSTAARPPSKSALWAQVAEVQKRATQQRLGTTRTPTSSSVSSIFKPKATLKSALKATSALSTKKSLAKSIALGSTSTSTPIQFVQHRLAATPNLIGFRKMFGPSSTPSLSATPNLAGMRSLFNVPITNATPGMEGLREMMKTPSATAGNKMLTSQVVGSQDGSPTPTVKAPVVLLVEKEIVQVEVAAEAIEAAPIATAEEVPIQEEEIVIEQEALPALVEESSITLEPIEAVVDELVAAVEVEVIPENEIVQPTEVIEEVEIEEVGVEEVVEAVQLEEKIALEQASEPSVVIEDVATEAEVEAEVEVEAHVEVEVKVLSVVEAPIEVEQFIVEVPVVVEEEFISLPIEKESPKVEESQIIESTPLLEELVAVVEKEEVVTIVEESLPTPEITLIAVVEQAEEEEEIIIAAPTRRGRPASTKATTKKVPVARKTKASKSVEIEVEKEELEIEEELEVITLPAKTKVSSSKAQVVAEVAEDIVPVVASRGRGRAKKVIEEVLAVDVVIEEAVVEKASAPKGRRGAKKAVEVVVEDVAEVEIPVIEKKKPAPRGRAKAAPKEALTIHEDSPEETVENQPKVVAAKSTRGKKVAATVEVNENEVVVKKATSKKATAASKVVEDVVVAPTRALRTRRTLA